MSETNKTYRIRTEVGTDKNLVVNLDQDYNTFEILSLQLSQEDTYRLQNVGYGVVVGRVLANGGFGIPNAKISVFIERDINDDTVLKQLYPYTSTRTELDGIRYNLLPDEQVDKCHRVVGTFPHKTYVLDNDDLIEIFEKYYKYTTRTNNAGDFIICGVPVGTQTIHMDLDLSDCGILSQRPRDFYYKGYNVEQFENPNQFKTSENLDSLSQIFSQDQIVNVIPFWGNRNQGETIGVTRCDIDVNFKFEPTCVFIGSIFSDSASNGVSKKCVPTNNMGAMDELVTGEGTIEMIRKTPDGSIEEFQVKGTEVINSDGVWCYQIPMNLDYMKTDEYGNMVPTDDPNKGIPTRTSVRFRVSMHDTEENTDNYFLSKVLVPNNPKSLDEMDYNFGSATKDTSFRDLFWNNVYTVKSYIPRFQKSQLTSSERFTGIKHSNISGNNNPIPYNNIRIKLPLMFTILCALIKTYIRVVSFLNVLIYYLGIVYGLLTFMTRERGNAFTRAVRNLKYIVLADGLCPDLENWYFAPGGRSTEFEVKDIKTTTEAGGSQDGIYDLMDRTFRFLTGDDVDKRNQWMPNNPNTDPAYRDEYEGVYDVTSVDFENTSGVTDDNKIKETVCLTSKVDYLLSCVEMNLAQEYKVINFDFYNDWLNGTIYLPRWNKYVTRKRSYLFNLIKIPAKIKGCISSSGGGNNSISFGRTRKYTQQCALTYGLSQSSNPSIQTSRGCTNNKKLQKCHKSGGFKQFNIFGYNGGFIQERTTSRNQYVYYVKPCEWDGGKKVNLFATDIVLLGSLNDCNEEGLPQAYKHLSSTTYIMPTNLALTNMDSDGYLYANSDGTICSKSKNYSNYGGVSAVTGSNQTYKATSKYYSTSSDENVSYRDLDDYVPLTEASGIAWNYTGPDQGEPDFEKYIYQPGGHFLGMSCYNSETNIKSCVNLTRICEAGASMSQRREVVKNFGDVKYIYYIPTGLISKDDIVDEDFRTMFASMNHNRLIATGFDTKTGYPTYVFNYKRPNAFDGSFERTNMTEWYNKNMENFVKPDASLSEIDYDYDPGIAKNSWTRTVGAPNKDYYLFRLGINSYSEQYDKYLVGNNTSNYMLPVFENSFYFYFGLHPGATAIDELNKQFFATCENDNTIDESGYEYVRYYGNIPESYTAIPYTGTVPPQNPSADYPKYIIVNGVYYMLESVDRVVNTELLTITLEEPTVPSKVFNNEGGYVYIRINTRELPTMEDKPYDETNVVVNSTNDFVSASRIFCDGQMLDMHLDVDANYSTQSRAATVSIYIKYPDGDSTNKVIFTIAQSGIPQSGGGGSDYVYS